jgi:peptide/nickel transport system substrate-binding protein
MEDRKMKNAASYPRILMAVCVIFSFSVVLAPLAFAGKSDNSIVWAAKKEITAVDPYFDTSREVLVLSMHIHDGLVYYDPGKNEYHPLLATKVTWVDNTTLEFDLRQGVVFHDGSTFGPEDVVYTINFIANEDNGVLNYGDIKWLDRAEKVDADTVRIYLDEPFPAALAYLSLTLPILPENHYEKAAVQAGGKRAYGAVEPMGTGPYKVTSFEPGKRLEAVANPDYFTDSPKGTPAIKKMVFRTIADDSTQIAELMTGGIDWIWGIAEDQANGLRGTPNLTVTNAPTMRISYLTFDIKGTSGMDHFTKTAVRQAFGHAINREAIAKSFMGPNSAVTNAACHPSQFGCESDVPVYDYNPQKAKDLLTQAGYPNGFTFDIYGYRQREVTEAIIGDLHKVGLKAKLRSMKYSALRDLIREGKVGVANMTWGSSSIPDISAITSYFFGGGPDDPAGDADVTAALKEGDMSTDPAVREAAYSRALKKIAKEAYWIPLFTYAKNYIFSSDLEFKPTPDEYPRFFTARWK